jgi:proliferating cell nuclear antigen
MSGLTKTDHLLVIHTVQSAALRFLIESLKDIIHDVNLVFTSTGGRICCMDSAKTALVFTALDAEGFEEYHCNEEKVVVGLNMQSLFKLLKAVGSTDVLTLAISELERHRLKIYIRNVEKNIEVVSSLRLLDLDVENITIPDITFDSVFIMPSHEFQRYIRDLHNIGEDITISATDNLLSLSVVGDFATQSWNIGEKSTGLTFQRRCKSKIQCKFQLKYLALFTKSSALCQVVELFLKPEYPVILRYSCGSLGRLQFALSPKVEM